MMDEKERFFKRNNGLRSANTDSKCKRILTNVALLWITLLLFVSENSVLIFCMYKSAVLAELLLGRVVFLCVNDWQYQAPPQYFFQISH
jgi:hypothetical protein